MTEKRERWWQNKEWHGKTKSHWRQPTGEGGQSSHVRWRRSKPQGKWKEISAEIDAVETIDEKQEHKERSMLKDLLHQLEKRSEDARNLDEAQARSYETELNLDRVLE